MARIIGKLTPSGVQMTTVTVEQLHSVLYPADEYAELTVIMEPGDSIVEIGHALAAYFPGKALITDGGSITFAGTEKPKKGKTQEALG